MARSSLTKRFFSYPIAKYEKATGKSILDLLDIGNIEFNRIIEIIKIGNNGIDEEEAAKILDDYLVEDDDHSIIGAFLDLIDDLDRDVKLLKTCGIKVSELKEQFKQEIESAVSGGGIFKKKDVPKDNVIPLNLAVSTDVIEDEI